MCVARSAKTIVAIYNPQVDELLPDFPLINEETSEVMDFAHRCGLVSEEFVRMDQVGLVGGDGPRGWTIQRGWTTQLAKKQLCQQELHMIFTPPFSTHQQGGCGV